MKAWVSLMGLYDHDDTLFDQLVLPASIDREDFITELLMQTAELEVVYASVPAMSMSIGAWSRTRLHTWERIEKVLYEDYDPFINIKRDEIRTIESEGSNTEQVSAWDSTTFTDRGHNSGTSSVTEHFHVEGDSAITDAQDVARKEVELRTKYDLYAYIINDFKNRYCLTVY